MFDLSPLKMRAVYDAQRIEYRGAVAYQRDDAAAGRHNTHGRTPADLHDRGMKADQSCLHARPA